MSVETCMGTSVDPERIIAGFEVINGKVQQRPIVHNEECKIRIRIREDEFVVAFVKSPNRVAMHNVADCGDHWELLPAHRVNISTAAPKMKDEPCRLEGWRPIASAPKDESKILILFDSASVAVVRLCWWNDGSWQQNGGDPDPEAIGWWSYKHSVTQEQMENYLTPVAWMPMPDCPFYPYPR